MAQVSDEDGEDVVTLEEDEFLEVPGINDSKLISTYLLSFILSLILDI